MLFFKVGANICFRFTLLLYFRICLIYMCCDVLISYLYLDADYIYISYHKTKLLTLSLESNSEQRSLYANDILDDERQIC